MMHYCLALGLECLAIDCLSISLSYRTHSDSVPVVYPETPGLSIHQKHFDDETCLSRLPGDWQLSIIHFSHSI